MSQGVQLNGNTYFLDNGVVTKSHGKGTKVVNNPDTISAVKAASSDSAHGEPVVEEIRTKRGRK